MAANNNWIESQKRVFCGWINMYIKRQGFELKGFDEPPGLRDGFLLCVLLEILSAKKMPVRYMHNATQRIHKLQNLSIAFKFMTEQGVRLVGCGAEDLCDGNIKLTLGLIWTLIQKFQIQNGMQRAQEQSASSDGPTPLTSSNSMPALHKQANAKKMLLTWAQEQLGDQGTAGGVTNLTSDWTDGKRFLGLIQKVRPDLVEPAAVASKDAHATLTLAFDLANDHFDIPKLLDPDYLLTSPNFDEQSLMTYLSLYPPAMSEAKAKADRAIQALQELAPTTIQPEPEPVPVPSAPVAEPELPKASASRGAPEDVLVLEADAPQGAAAPSPDEGNEDDEDDFLIPLSPSLKAQAAVIIAEEHAGSKSAPSSPAPDEASRARKEKRRKQKAEPRMMKAAAMLVPLEKGSKFRVFSLKVVRNMD